MNKKLQLSCHHPFSLWKNMWIIRGKTCVRSSCLASLICYAEVAPWSFVTILAQTTTHRSELPHISLGQEDDSRFWRGPRAWTTWWIRQATIIVSRSLDIGSEARARSNDREAPRSAASDGGIVLQKQKDPCESVLVGLAGLASLWSAKASACTGVGIREFGG